MKVAIFVSGAMSNGLNSPTPGEGRYAQNLARMLADNGHHVDCISGAKNSPPSWGSDTPHPNVTIGYAVNPNKPYDLVLYMPWEHTFRNKGWESCLTVPLTAKWYVHCQFSWGKSIKDDHTCYNNNHALAYPYVQEGAQFPTDREDNPYPTFALPMPIYGELAPLNIHNRKNIMWSTKDVFHNEWPEGHHVPRIGLATIKAIKKLREKYEFETRFLSTRFFNPDRSKHARDMDIQGLVGSIPDASMHDLVPRNTLMDWFSTSRVTAIVSGLLGSFGESIASGSVPMCYTGHIYREPAKRHGLILDTFKATEDQIYNCIERLFADDEFYSRVINDYRHELRHYSYKNAYKYFEEMCKNLGLM